MRIWVIVALDITSAPPDVRLWGPFVGERAVLDAVRELHADAAANRRAWEIRPLQPPGFP